MEPHGLGFATHLLVPAILFSNMKSDILFHSSLGDGHAALLVATEFVTAEKGQPPWYGHAGVGTVSLGELDLQECPGGGAQIGKGKSTPGRERIHAFCLKRQSLLRECVPICSLHGAGNSHVHLQK